MEKQNKKINNRSEIYSTLAVAVVAFGIVVNTQLNTQYLKDFRIVNSWSSTTIFDSKYGRAYTDNEKDSTLDEVSDYPTTGRDIRSPLYGSAKRLDTIIQGRDYKRFDEAMNLVREEDK